MTEENNQPQKTPVSPKKKWLLVSLCSVALLGGAVGYGMYNNNDQTSQQATNVEQHDSGVQKKKKEKSAWEKQVDPKAKDKESKKNKSESKDSTDNILGMIIGNGKTDHLFSSSKSDNKSKKSLLEKIQEALDVEEQKEDKRQKMQVVHAAEIVKENSNGVTLSESLKKAGFNTKEDELNKNKDDKLVVPGEKSNDTPKEPLEPIPPVNPETPIEPHNPDIPINPDIPETPIEPEKPDDSLNKMINHSKENLVKSTDSVVQVNKKLHDIKSELNNLKNIDPNTLEIAGKSENQWNKVQQLVTEYNQLSGQLKELLDKDGNIDGINMDLYGQTYASLIEKVSDIKNEQKNAQKVTNIMNTNIEKAQETANTIEDKTTDYENTQNDVQNATANVQNAVNEANQNPAVQVAVQPEINQANAKVDSLNQVNATTGEALNQVLNQDNQLNIDAAQQTAAIVNNQAEVANQAVNDVMDDYTSLPQPPVAPTTPSDQTEQVPVESSNQSSTVTETADIQIGTSSTDVPMNVEQ